MQNSAIAFGAENAYQVDPEPSRLLPFCDQPKYDDDYGYDDYGYDDYGYDDYGYSDHGYSDHGYDSHGWKPRIDYWDWIATILALLGIVGLMWWSGR